MVAVVIAFIAGMVAFPVGILVLQPFDKDTKELLEAHDYLQAKKYGNPFLVIANEEASRVTAEHERNASSQEQAQSSIQ